jgi:Ser/Thr protein kinase RdoA (MazF antagonist)
VARIFPRARSLEVVKGDAEILAHLEQRGFPAERLAHAHAVSVHEDQAVLVTLFAPGAAPPGDETTFKMFGDLLGQLHTMHTVQTQTAPHSGPGAAPATTSALARPGGAWHHLVPQGPYSEEVAAALALLEEARPRVPATRMAEYEALRDELARADDCAGLPVGLVHPDFVPVNGVASPAGDVVIVDWAGAGAGPRLPSFAFLLWAAADAGNGCVQAAVSGYRQHVQLEPAELDRLEAALPVRWTLIQAWSVLVGRRRLAAVADELPAGRARAAHVAARARQAFG